MARKSGYLTPEEAEKILQCKRIRIGFIDSVETTAVKTMIETAKQNGRFGDKVLMVINPLYIHIPSWQRKLRVINALRIGIDYNEYKWEIPKIIYIDDKLKVIDGMHRIYGAAKVGIDAVTVEIIDGMTEREAIRYFLDQRDRRNMSPVDTYNAAIEANIPEYIMLRKICTRNNVQVRGDKDGIENPVGIFTSISDGINLVKNNPCLLDKILKLIKKLQWGGGNIYNAKVYSAKVIRVLKKLYAYYEDRQKVMEKILLKNCKGVEYFNDNLEDKCQESIFDILASVIEENINIEPIQKNNKVKRIAKLS